MNKFLMFFVFITATLFSQEKKSTCELLSKINTIFKEKHYLPKPIDDSLSVFVFDNFIDELDQNHSLFTKSEYDILSKNRLNIDNEILKGNCTFFDDFITLYTKALYRKKRIIEKIEKTELNYNGTDTIRYTKKAVPFDLLENGLEKVYNKRIRFDILDDIAVYSKNIDSLKQNFSSIEKISRKKIFETEICKIETILNSKNGISEDLKSKYLNYFCTYFDPHSSYFSYDDKSSFMSALSTSNYSLGLDVTLNDNDEIIVADIIPGGPAYKSKKIDKGDIIINVGTGLGENYSVSCSSLDKIGNLVFSDNYKSLLLTFRKKNGKTLEINIQKELMNDEENSIESFVIENEIRVGYIKIPSFYSDYEGNTNKGCANDVRKEIEKFEKEKIEGLIIDLQDNGGGSMEEAQKMVGMFVNSGPISICVDHNKNQEILRDNNKGAIYNGSIVMLINGNTASASEFFAAAMQDYNRAIIIGSKSFGKASMQTIVPVFEKSEQNFVKITIEKFYRITGKSHQLLGIIPDVVIPNLFDSITQREDKYKSALKNDTLVSNVRYTVFGKKNNNQAIFLSKKRVDNNLRFKEVNILNKEIDSVMDLSKTIVLMNFEDIFKKNHSSDMLYDKIKLLSEKEINCNVLNLANNKLLKKKSYQKEINDFEIKNIKSNPYIEEGLNIIRDLNKL